MGVLARTQVDRNGLPVRCHAHRQLFDLHAGTARFLRLALCRVLWLCSGTMLLSVTAGAQDNYEIQVYGSETVKPSTTMVELHSNFTVNGSKALPGSRYAADGTFPTNHAQHETIEITQGINSWAEVGFYLFTSINSEEGWQWVGDHIRPRVRAPDSWRLPVGLSISNEIGYQRARYSPDTWTWEIRPKIGERRVGKEC